MLETALTVAVYAVVTIVVIAFLVWLVKQGNSTNQYHSFPEAPVWESSTENIPVPKGKTAHEAAQETLRTHEKPAVPGQWSYTKVTYEKPSQK